MNYARVTVLAGALCMGALACAHETTRSASTTAGGRRATLEQLTAMQSAEVPANTAFRVVMDETLSSATAQSGQTFTATLTAPIITKDVRVAAPAGSKLHGHVVAVQSGSEPRIAVAFDSIETPSGLYGIEAHANEAMNAPFTIGSVRDDEASADTVFRPGGGAVGGGPRAEGYEESPTTMVVVPKSSEVELVLTSPLTITLMSVR